MLWETGKRWAFGPSLGPRPGRSSRVRTSGSTAFLRLAHRLMAPRGSAFHHRKDEIFLERFTISAWREYELWLFRNRNFTLHKLKELNKRVNNFKSKPKVSIIMPVYNPDPHELRQAIDSVLWQAYPHWELCIVDDCSDNLDYLKALYRLSDRRIKIKVKNENTGIADTSQHALEMATGKYIALMDQDDELYPDALYSFIDILQRREVDFFYSDRDMISPNEGRYMHLFKPDWSPEYLLSFNYTSHFEIYKKSLVLDVGGFRKGYEGSQDYDLTLRITEQTNKIYHHPMILYSWRQSQSSIASNPNMKSYIFQSGIKAIADTVRRRNLPVTGVTEDETLWRGHYKITWDNSIKSGKKIFLIMIGRCLEETVRLRNLFEDAMRSFDVEFISTDYDIENINKALKNIHRDGYVYFCDDNVIEIVSDGLIDTMGYLTIDGVSVVGCKFIDSENKIFNVGLSIATSGKLLFSYRGSPRDEKGYGGVTMMPRNVSLVFPSFWGCKSSVLQERNFLCSGKGYFYSVMNFFKMIIKSGERITCVPYMCLRIDKDRLNYDEETNAFLDQWMEEGLKDKYYNPNLTDIYEDFGLKV